MQNLYRRCMILSWFHTNHILSNLVRGSKNISGLGRGIRVERKLCCSFFFGGGAGFVTFFIFLVNYSVWNFPASNLYEHCNIWRKCTGELTCIPPLNSSVSKRGIHAVGINTLYDWLSKYPLSRIKIHLAWNLK